MIVIPAGEFIMGSRDGEGRDDERPQRNVVIARPFAVSQFEITFDQWDACVAHGGCSYEGKNESWGRGQQPMNRVSWNDANSYVRWLSRQTGKAYRLLTEAEWEYAARARTSTPYSHGVEEASLGDFAWYIANSGNRTHPVGTKQANAFGVFDMSGNVWEWVEDCYADSYQGAPTDGSAVAAGSDQSDSDCGFRVLRGGSWFSEAGDVRPAVRYGYTARFRNENHGFRVTRTLSISP
jgi:formylglycine-generating enzyme required for sulfatase activity